MLNVETWLLLIASITLFCVLFDVKLGFTITLPKITWQSREKEGRIEGVEDDISEHLSVRESVIVREKQHDERIRKMKEELALKNAKVREKGAGVVADELDGVRNLPHSIIDEQARLLPDVEET